MTRAFAILLTLGLGAGPAVADRAPPPPYKARATTKAMRTLELFIYEGDPYQRGRPPKGLVRKDVDAYLAAAITDGGFPIEAANAMEKVASLYRTPRAATAALATLTRAEQTAADVSLSIVLARIALHGDATQRAAVAQYFPWLCQKLETSEHANGLVSLFHRLGGAVTADALKAGVDARIAALAPAVNRKDYAAEVETHQLRALANNGIPQVEHALTTQQALAAETDEAKRLSSVVDIYLQLDSQSFFVSDWAEGVLADMATSSKGRARVARSFRASLPRIAKAEAELQEFARIRALHALQYFGGTLTKGETAFVAKHANDQIDWFAR